MAVQKKKFYRHASLYIKETPKKGRGVFTIIHPQTIIEVAPVIVLTSKDRKEIDKTALMYYIFEWQAYEPKGCAVALGWVSIFNHSSPSNCDYVMDYDEQHIKIVAKQKILPGEELTINYNGKWYEKDTEIWFEVHE
jgi:SET domain-containing protein